MASRLGAIVLVLVILINFVSSELAGLRFYLYTKSNKNAPVELKYIDVRTFGPPFVVDKPVKFLCHGYTSSYTAEFPQDMKNVYLGLSETYNVVAVDWGQLASAVVGYETAAANTRFVGQGIAELMTALISAEKSRLEDFHFIGHSLGGQVGAFISSHLGSGARIPRVTGLDPARPGFNTTTTPKSERLDSSDADFVDVIRTSPGVDSTSTVPDPPIGSADFYPNNGLKQPGCLLDLLNLCSHSRAYKYYTESLTKPNGFKAFNCSSYQDYKSTNCLKINPAYMGESVLKSITGVYYLDTNSFSPFAKGEDKVKAGVEPIYHCQFTVALVRSSKLHYGNISF